MKVYLLFISILFGSNVSTAQFLLQDKQGVIMSELSYTEVIGSPYLHEQFSYGRVNLSNGYNYENVLLKYDLYKDELYFKNEGDSLLSFIVPVKSFELLGQKYINGLPPADKFTLQSFYQVLCEEKVQLLVKEYKTILESKQYNSATLEKKFENHKTFYVLQGGKMKRFEPSKKSCLEIFGDKRKEIEDFLNKIEVDFKNTIHITKLFEYYNSL